MSSSVACVSQAAARVSPAAARVSPDAARVSPLDARRVSLALSLSPVLLCQRARLPSTNFKTVGGWKLFFPGILRDYIRTLSHPTPLQQPTEPPQLWSCALGVVTPWSLDLLDLNTLELWGQLARLPSKLPYLDYESLRMDRVSKVGPVQEVCWTPYLPNPPPQHSTRPLKLWPRALRQVGLWRVRLLDLDTLGLGLRRQRASLPSKITPRLGGPSRWAALRKQLFSAG